MSRTYQQACDSFANSIENGTKLVDAYNHHAGMRTLKARLGDPKPDLKELSLINPTSNSCYWGNRKGSRARLSIDPGDYIWEDPASNSRRTIPQYIQMFEVGLVDRNGDPIE